MKRIYFRILAICISLVLTFSILYKDSIQAEALEWVGVAVGYDTALKFLLGLLGVSVGVGVAQEVDWGTLRQNAVQVQLDQGNSQAEVSAWWSNVIHGSLDTASDCWASFKEYVSSLTASNSDNISVTGGTFLVGNTNYTIKDFQSYYGNYSVSGVSYRGFLTSADPYDSGGRLGHFLIASNTSSDLENSLGNFNLYDFTYDNKTVYYRCVYRNYTFIVSPVIPNIEINSNGIFSDQTTKMGLLAWLSVYGIPETTGDFEALYPNIEDIALNPENADTLATDVIPLPWENIGASDTDIEGIIDDAISRVIDGTMSLENYWEYVQNITNTYAYSIENNYLLPNENGEDKKADDKVKENAENGAFVLYGLEKVFPFCIPFDIYAFITLLKADPVAPIIEYPIYNPVTQENEIITIDFSEWESVVIIFRYIFDFLLIIGLLLLARPLVGAGGDS